MSVQIPILVDVEGIVIVYSLDSLVRFKAQMKSRYTGEKIKYPNGILAAWKSKNGCKATREHTSCGNCRAIGGYRSTKNGIYIMSTWKGKGCMTKTLTSKWKQNARSYLQRKKTGTKIEAQNCTARSEYEEEDTAMYTHPRKERGNSNGQYNRPGRCIQWNSILLQEREP